MSPNSPRRSLDGVGAQRNEIRNLSQNTRIRLPRSFHAEWQPWGARGRLWTTQFDVHGVESTILHAFPLSLGMGRPGTWWLSRRTSPMLSHSKDSLCGSQRLFSGVSSSFCYSLTMAAVLALPWPGDSDDKITAHHVSKRASRFLQTTMKHHPGSELTVPQLIYALKLKLRRTVEHEMYVSVFSPFRLPR